MSPEEQINNDIVMFRAGFAAGREQGRAEVHCAHVHPQISASVARMFEPWCGAEVARRESVERFKAVQGVDR